MKTLIILISSFLLSSNVFAQKDYLKYDNPYFEFYNQDSLKSIGLNNYTKVDLFKLKYEAYSEGDGVSVDIPFYVNKNITKERDFIFSMLSGPTWSVLKEDKTAIVKTFNRMRDDQGQTYGIYQLNNDLTEPIKPGKYYIRLILEQKPKEETIIYIYLGNALKGD